MSRCIGVSIIIVLVHCIVPWYHVKGCGLCFISTWSSTLKRSIFASDQIIFRVLESYCSDHLQVAILLLHVKDKDSEFMPSKLQGNYKSYFVRFRFFLGFLHTLGTILHGFFILFFFFFLIKQIYLLCLVRKKKIPKQKFVLLGIFLSSLRKNKLEKCHYGVFLKL